MPELPEVETIRRDLAERITGKKIAGVSVRHAKTVRGAPAVFSRRLVGRSVRAIHRVGKLLIFIFDVPDYQLLVHLKMTGQLIYRGQTALVAGGHFLSGAVLELPGRHTRVVISFSDGAELFFNVGNVFAGLQNPERAIEYYAKAVDINPGALDAVVNLSILSFQQGRYIEAGKYLDKAVELGYKVPEGYREAIEVKVHESNLTKSP